MNTLITKLALDANLINYIDHETPRVYFIDGHADIEDVNKFASLLIESCAAIIESQDIDPSFRNRLAYSIRERFGINE